MNFDDFAILRIHFLFLTNSEATAGIKNADLSEKVGNYDYKKIFYQSDLKQYMKEDKI